VITRVCVCVCVCVCLSVRLSGRKITDERLYGCRPNLGADPVPDVV